VQSNQEPSASGVPALHCGQQDRAVLDRTIARADEGGQVSDPTNKSEPIAPTVGFVTHAGDTSGRTADYDAYMRDIAETQARTAAFEAKRQQNKPQEPKVELSAIDAALIALEEAAQDFEGPNGYGKPNQPLIESRKIVAELTAKLAEEQAKLTAIEARGDSVQRLTNAVASAETQLQSLVGKAETAEILRLAEEKYGWKIGWARISPEVKRDLKNHASSDSTEEVLRATFDRESWTATVTGCAPEADRHSRTEARRVA
jgi:hypothetical protein